MRETICLLRRGSGMDFDRYVEWTFKTADAAYRFQNNQTRNVSVVVLPGTWRTGQRVPTGPNAPRGRTLT